MLSLKVQSDNGFMRKEYFTLNGRTAFKIAIRSFGLSTEDVILLPAYIGITDKEGSGVLDPIEEGGTSYAFYAVDENLSPVIEDLQKKIHDQRVKAVLVIHYFGFPPKNFDAIIALCRAEKKLRRDNRFVPSRKETTHRRLRARSVFLSSGEETGHIR